MNPLEVQLFIALTTKIRRFHFPFFLLGQDLAIFFNWQSPWPFLSQEFAQCDFTVSDPVVSYRETVTEESNQTCACALELVG